MNSKCDYENVIGVDVAKAKLDIYQSHSGELRVIGNNAEAISLFAERIQASKMTTLVVMEGTGGYEALLADILIDHQIDCAIANPRQVRDFIRGCGKIEKNDPIDATHLSFFGQVVQPKPLKKRDERAVKLKLLIHRREQLLKQLTQEKNRLQQMRDRELQEMIQAVIDFLKEQCKQLERKIAECLKQCETHHEVAEIVSSVKGIGPIITATLVSELPELGTLNRGEIAKLAGVAPIVRDSGTSSRKRQTSGGRPLVRKAIYMAVIVGIRWNERIRTHYKKLLARGKPVKVAIVACMRKLLTILNSMVKNRQKWGENKLAT